MVVKPLEAFHSISPIFGTSADAIDLCEDRERLTTSSASSTFDSLRGQWSPTTKKHTRQPKMAFRWFDHPMCLGAEQCRYAIAADFENARRCITVSDQHLVLMDRYLEAAIEYDVDALCDGEEVMVAGIMEHIEEAGVRLGLSFIRQPDVV